MVREKEYFTGSYQGEAKDQLRDLEILLGVKGINPLQRDAGIKILSRGLNWHTRRVVVFGEPGANKTTFIGQLRQAMEKRGKTISEIHYDSEIPDDITRNTWTAEDWINFSSRFYNKILDLTPAKKQEDQVLLVETLSVGTKFDRAVSTLERIASDSAKQGERSETVFVGIVPDPRTQAKTGRIRDLMASGEIPDDQIIDILARRFKTVVPYHPGLTREEAGKIVRGIFLKAGPNYKIKIISNEVLDEALKTYPKNYEPGIIFANDSNISQKQLRERTAKALYVRRIMLAWGINDEASFPVVSPFSEKIVHLFLSEVLNPAA